MVPRLHTIEEFSDMDSGSTRQDDIFRKCVGVVMVVAILFGLLELVGVIHV